PEAMKATPGDIRLAAELGLKQTTIVEAQPGGASHALSLLHSFLHELGEHYQQAISSPVDGRTFSAMPDRLIAPAVRLWMSIILDGPIDPES
ncbi:MAG: hypothetical protein ACOC0P_05000, partial [Planctomycetota bacterium]